MAYTCAVKAYEATQKLHKLLALTILTSLQAIDFIPVEQAPITRKIHDYVRKEITFMENDELLYPKQEKVLEMVRDESLLYLLEENGIQFVV